MSSASGAATRATGLGCRGGPEGAATGGSDGPSPTEGPRPWGLDRRQAIRRVSYLALGLVAAGLTVRAVIGEGGLVDAHRARVELARVRAEEKKWEQRNAVLEARIKALRTDPSTIERIARERLDWVRPGEITYLFPYDASVPDRGDPGPVAPGEFAPVEPGEIAR